MNGPRDGAYQKGFRQTWHTFKKKVSRDKQCDKCALNHDILTHNDLANASPYVLEIGSQVLREDVGVLIKRMLID